jgi:hypothetical protein
VGKTLLPPYPGQSMSEYREQLVNFQKNYWSFLKPSKGGSKFIPLPPEHLKPKEMRPNIIPAVVSSIKKKSNKMSSRKLNEHVEEELFNKEKRVTTPKIKKEIPSPPQSEPRVIKEGEQPVKKKKPYYRKKYTKPTPVEIIPEPVEQHLFVKGLIVGVIVTSIIGRLIWAFS